MLPLVSIIIPNYNRANLISETLDSIISQTYHNWECLVVDDGSTDDSETVVRGYCERDKRILFYKRPETKPKGANACRNYGLELSKGAYINWLDSDDLMHPDKLKIQLEILVKTDAPFCVCQSFVFENSIDHIIGLKSGHLISEHAFDDFIDKKFIIPVQAPIFKKDFLELHHYRFDETLQAAQEWYFFATILFKHSIYEVVNEPLDYIRSHPNNISNANSDLTYWHYFLARLKLYRDLKDQLSAQSLGILQIFFLFFFKKFVRTASYKKALFVWHICLLPIKRLSIKDHANLLAGLFAYKVSKKGDRFLSKVSLYSS